MIKNLWKNTTFLCMNHESYIPLEPRAGTKELFYACPKYAPENRTTDEKPCMNNMYTQDAESAVEYVSDKIEEYENNGISSDAVIGLEWSKRDVDYKVISYQSGYLKIGVLNRRALSKIR